MSELRLLDRVRDAIRVRQYSLVTEKSCLGWIRKFILYHGKRHPGEMSKLEIESFLSYLAVKRQVSPSTQNQALHALLFLYRHVLEVDLPWLDDVVRAKPKRRVPVVLSRHEVRLLPENVPVARRLIASLLYGAGLRVTECLRLRVGDLDFSRCTVRIHSGKGGKDRITVLPDNLAAALHEQIAGVRVFHDHDIALGSEFAKFPLALRRKLGKSSRRFFWQLLFPSNQISEDPREPGAFYRWHVHPTTVRKAIGLAAGKAGINKRVTCHTLRIPSPRTCWSPARTSGPFSSCSGTTTSKPR